jgi:hypothetical protein
MSRARTYLPQNFQELADEYPQCFEVRRIWELSPERQERQWRLMRASRSTIDMIPRALGMDVIFYRFPSEREYCQRHSFPRTGDLADPEGSVIALDSAKALWEGSRQWKTGDPGRLLEEIRQEYRSADRYRLLVPWQQTEVHNLHSTRRNALYFQAPRWWYVEWWTSVQMFVPLPPFLTYRASYLIEDSRDSAYWHAVFEAEWVTLVLSRWCADILQRGIMWRLPGQARAGIDTMGIVKLLRDSPYGEGQLRRWLYDHDVYLWGAKYMSRMIRGPSRGSEALYENVEEFVRVYTPSTEPLPERAFRVLPGYLSPATQSYRQSYRKTSPGYDENNQVEFEPNPNPVGNQPSSVVRPTASLIQEGNSPTALTPGTATQPTVIPHASEAPPMASDQMNHGKIPGSPQSPVLDSPSHRNLLLESSSFQPRADSPLPYGTNSPLLESPSLPSKFDRVDRVENRTPLMPTARTSPKPSNLLSPRTGPDGGQDLWLPRTLQERLRAVRVLPILHISARGYYRPNAQGEQPLTEDVLVETIRRMNNIISESDQLLRNARAARDIAEERLRNAELLVQFLRNEAARETQGYKRPREEPDP